MSGDNKEIRFRGAGVSPGLARGVIHVVRAVITLNRRRLETR